MLLKNTKGEVDALAPYKIKNLLLRTLSYIVLAPLCLFLLWKGETYAFALLFIAFGMVAYEWIKLIIPSAFPLYKKLLWFFLGFIYIGVAFITFKTFISYPKGNYLLMIIAGLVWASDTGGYIFGTIFRGPKLAASISPNKTWSGLAGGFLLTWLTTYIIFKFNLTENASPLLTSVYVAFPLSFVAQIGDLLESWAKRRFNVKDTGKLIPGHGGAIDRLDGLIAVGFTLGLITLISRKDIISILANLR